LRLARNARVWNHSFSFHPAELHRQKYPNRTERQGEQNGDCGKNKASHISSLQYGHFVPDIKFQKVLLVILRQA
jgi:hypothetical protein